MRKVHRYGFDRVRRRIPYREPRTHLRAACGVPLFPGTPDVGRGIPDDAFVNLPAASQCRSCRAIVPKAHNGVGFGHATEEQVVGMETMFLAFARLATDMLELRRDPEWRHRCWCSTVTTAIFAPLAMCGGCGHASWTDPRRWEWEIGQLLRPGEKYCYANICRSCRQNFYSERPRGADPVCLLCRGSNKNDPEEEHRLELAFG